MMTPDQEFKGRRVTVMGLGRFGGGVGVTRWLAERGARVLVTDLDTEENLRASVLAVNDLVASGSVKLRLGEHEEADFSSCDLVVANPAVPRPWENRFLSAARAAGVEITTEIRLVVERLPERRRVIGVTGSAGKSTTSAMIAHILSELGEDFVFGGNIGGSLLRTVGGVSPRTWVVLELSSFMLHWLGGWSPGVAVVTSYAPNHLDWHGGEDHYRASKQALLASQKAGDIAVLPATLAGWTVNPQVREIRLDGRRVVDGLVIPGLHNHRNAAMAVETVLAAVTADDRDSDRLRQKAEAAVRTFPGLPHRLELVGQWRGIRFFNDSKSTTPESTLLAVASFAEEPGVGAQRVHLIAGGYDKGSDLAPIGRLAGLLGGLYTIGVTGPAIDRESGGKSIPSGSLDGAIAACWPRLKPGDLVLMSPGCASWDQFDNYEARGRRFKELVTAWMS